MRGIFKISIVVICVVCLSSCSKEKLDRTKYIPTEANVVLKFNAKDYFKDTFDDYLTDGKAMYSEIAEGVFGMIAAPDVMGLESFEDHYLFVHNINDSNFVAGVVLALNSGKKMTTYIESNGLEIEEVSGVKHAVLDYKTNIVWDDQTAVIQHWSTPLNYERKVSLKLFSKIEWKSADNTNNSDKKAIQDFKASTAHVTILTSKSEGSHLLNNLPIFNKYGNLFDAFLESNKTSVSEFNINERGLNIRQKTYFNREEAATQLSEQKENTITKKMILVPKSQPQVWFSASLSQEALLREIKHSTFASELFKEYLSAFFSAKEACSYLNGDVFFTYNGTDVSEQLVFGSSFNQKTGEYESGNEKKMVQQAYYTLALGLIDGQQFKKKLEPLSLFFNYSDGIYNFKENYFFHVNENILYLATTKKGEKLLKRAEKTEALEYLSLSEQHPATATFNVANQDASQAKFMIDGLKEITCRKFGIIEDCKVSEFDLGFAKDSNAVIELTKTILNIIDKSI